MKQIKQYTVFISCPGDVSDERQIVTKALDDFVLINDTDVHFKPVHYKSNVSSSFKNLTPQEIINESLPPYDIYIGIMGARFGTPTKSYQSGTQEEFEIALEKQKKGDCKRVSFLFKSITIKGDEWVETQYEQYAKVRAFKQKLSPEGIWQSFAENNELTNIVYGILRDFLREETNTESLRNHQLQLITSVPSSSIFNIKNDFFGKFLNYSGAKLSNKYKTGILLEDIYTSLDVSEYTFSDDDNEFLETDEPFSTIAIDDFVNQAETYTLLSGDEGSGKTTLCKKIYLNFHAKGVIPVYIKGVDIKNSNIEHLLKLVEKNFLSQYSENSRAAYEKLDKSKKLLIIDDLSSSSLNDKHKLRIIHLLKEYFNHVFITIDEIFLFNISLTKLEEYKDITYYRLYKLHDIGHLLRDELIRKWLSAGREETISKDELYYEAEKYRSIIDNIIGTNFVPKKPLSIVILLQAIEGGTPTDLSNYSYVRYYKYLIDTTILTTVEKSKHDLYYAFLPVLAYEIFESSTDGITEENFKTLQKRFSDQKGLPESLIEDVKGTLVSIEGLEYEAGVYKFKHPFTYYFFLGQYLSENINKEPVKKQIKEVCDNLHLREYANIIIFLSYHSSDDFILQSISEVALKVFANEKVFEFEKNSKRIQEINHLVDELPKLVLHPKEEEQRAIKLKSRDRADRATKKSNGEKEKIENNPLELSVQLNLAIRSTEILGHLLKNHYVKFDAEPKKKIFILAVNAALKSLNVLIGLLADDVDALTEQLKDRCQISDDDKSAKKYAKRIVFGLANLIAFSIIKSTSQYTGAENLSRIYEEILKSNEALAYKFVDFSIKLDTETGFPLTEMRNLVKDCQDNYLAMSLIRNLVGYRLYMRPIDDYRKKQQICDSVGIKIPKQIALQKKGKKAG